jgi:hypothetical protein
VNRVTHLGHATRPTAPPTQRRVPAGTWVLDLLRSSRSETLTIWATLEISAVSRGTDGSNPVPSSGESANSRSQHVAEGIQIEDLPLAMELWGIPNLMSAVRVARACYDKYRPIAVLPPALRDDIDALAGYFHGWQCQFGLRINNLFGPMPRRRCQCQARRNRYD